jgi:cysteine desulfurase/selenocysteine lyase
MPIVTTATLDTLRREMEPSSAWAYFDHAAISPLPARTAQRMIDYADESSRMGGAHWLKWVAEVEVARGRAAQLLGAEAEEIAFVTNTTEGINVVAEGLDWKPNDNVVTLADEFPTNLYPWLHLESRGVEVRQLPTDFGYLDLNRLADACDQRTRVIAISWVGYQTGYRHDLKAIADIAHRVGALAVIDAIQGLGVFPLDVAATGVDVVACGGHKWLLGPEGAGILCVRREHLDRLRPLGVGWNSVVHALNYNKVELDLKHTASRYEGGTANMAGNLALGQSLELLVSISADTLSRQVLECTDKACTRLEQIGAVVKSHRGTAGRADEEKSGIVCFDLPGRNLPQVRDELKQQQIAIGFRGGNLRISPHGYNSDEDLDRLIGALEDIK